MDDFQTTRWSLVLEARGGAELRSRHALEKLCRAYRAPVVAYIARSGAAAADVEDLAQTFFTRFVDRAFHAQADPARGRFRAFLLTALKNFLIDAHGQAHAMKRGGHVVIHSIDAAASGNGSDELVDAETPDQVFDRAWAQAVLHAALRKLRREAREAGKLELFDALGEFLVERPDDADYARVAAKLGMRRNTLAVAVHRLRNRLRELVWRELADTAADDADLQQEMAHLRHSLGALLE